MVVESQSHSSITTPPPDEIELKILRQEHHTTKIPSEDETTSRTIDNPNTLSQVSQGESVPTPVSYEGGKRSRQQSAHDGVFSNMSALPEIMVLPKVVDGTDPPPAYDVSTEYEGGNSSSSNGALQYDEIIVDDLEVGGYPVFLLYLIIAIFFEWIGFILALTLSQSHAARYGSWAGLGITIALQSVQFSDFVSKSPYWQAHKDSASFLGFALAFGGYVVFLYGLFSYHRMRNAAQERTSSGYNTNFIGVL